MTHNKYRKGFALSFFLFLLVSTTSAQQKFGGLMWQHEILIIAIAGALMITAFAKSDIPIIGAISGIWFTYGAIAANKLIIYTADGTKITNMQFFHLTYLFGLTGFLMILYSIYNYIVFARDKVTEFDKQTPSGRINREF